ncbi:MAG: hypothetical protein ACNI27_15330 [Desulfovibrio sp.]
MKKTILLYTIALLLITNTTYAYTCTNDYPLIIGTPVKTLSTPPDAPVQMTTTKVFHGRKRAELQSGVTYTPSLASPKSCIFSVDGEKVYVNALEGYQTLVFSSKALKKISTIKHTFTPSEKHLFSHDAPAHDAFHGTIPSSGPNTFKGKPVELAVSHNGKYLWIPYYRRDYDTKSQCPAAMALVDTATDSIIKVFHTGPVAKNVTASPDNKYVAVTNWGDNTVMIFNTSGNDPDKFHLAGIAASGKQLDVSNFEEDVDRDKDSGHCLRGVVFSPDSKYLLAGRMCGGGVSLFRITPTGMPEYINTLHGMRPTPRDLKISPDGKDLYISSNYSGYVSRINLQKFISAALTKKQDAWLTFKDFVDVNVGGKVRTLELTEDGKYAFGALNSTSELVCIQTKDMKVVSRLPIDSYPVGLAISPDNSKLWVTSQGRCGQGGHVVTVVNVDYR